MTIKISGSREQIAQLAHDLRMEGRRFDFYLRSPQGVREKQCITMCSQLGTLHYYQCVDPDVIGADKELQIHLPSHRKHFLTKVQEFPYGYKRQAS